MGVTGDSLDLEDALLDGQEGDAEISPAKVENQDVALADGLPIETIGDGDSGGLVDDPEDVQATDGTSVLRDLALGTVEVGGDGKDGVCDDATKLRLGGLLHLGQDHGGDFLGRLETKSETRLSSVKRSSNLRIHRPCHGTGP